MTVDNTISDMLNPRWHISTCLKNSSESALASPLWGLIIGLHEKNCFQKHIFHKPYEEYPSALITNIKIEFSTPKKDLGMSQRSVLIVGVSQSEKNHWICHQAPGPMCANIPRLQGIGIVGHMHQQVLAGQKKQRLRIGILCFRTFPRLPLLYLLS